MNIAITMCAWRRPDNLEKVLDSITSRPEVMRIPHLSSGIDGGLARQNRKRWWNA